jgi:hypothetical protein
MKIEISKPTTNELATLINKETIISLKNTILDWQLDLLDYILLITDIASCVMLKNDQFVGFKTPLKIIQKKLSFLIFE